MDKARAKSPVYLLPNSTVAMFSLTACPREGSGAVYCVGTGESRDRLIAAPNKGPIVACPKSALIIDTSQSQDQICRCTVRTV